MGNQGLDAIGDWFEISNVGSTAWTAVGGPALCYKDDSFSAAATVIQGLTSGAAPAVIRNWGGGYASHAPYTRPVYNYGGLACR